MSIKLKKFSPRPGLVNKQGRLPDPSELVCIEVPKIFDQCLIKKCLLYSEGPDTITTDMELLSDALINSPKRYIGSRDFTINLTSIDKIPLKSDPNYKKLIISYSINFFADYIDNDGVNRSEEFEVNRTDTIGKFYCPDSIAQISASTDEEINESGFIKLEMVAEALIGKIIEIEDNFFLEITLGYFITVKCALTVQLLIPAYDYCPVPNAPCEEEEEDNPCEVFEKSPVPKFYPDQNLKPLFIDPEEYDKD